MKLNDVYPSKYLKSGDITETPVSYTISSWEIEEIGKNRDEKLVLYFDNEDKGLVTNKTNANTIAKVLGSEETDEWIGKSIKLYSTEVQFGDEMVEAIRVSLKPGQKTHRGVGPSGPEADSTPTKASKNPKVALEEAQAINTAHETPAKVGEDPNW